MIVYFENGSITNEALYSSSGEEMIKVDAGMGYNHCRRRLRQIDEKYPFDELTTRELRRAHNLEKLYVNGEFGFVES